MCWQTVIVGDSLVCLGLLPAVWKITIELSNQEECVRSTTMAHWLKVYNNDRTFDKSEHCVKYKKMAGQSETVLCHIRLVQKVTENVSSVLSLSHEHFRYHLGPDRRQCQPVMRFRWWIPSLWLAVCLTLQAPSLSLYCSITHANKNDLWRQFLKRTKTDTDIADIAFVYSVEKTCWYVGLISGAQHDKEHKVYIQSECCQW